jgi:hypothetical protein
MVAPEGPRSTPPEVPMVALALSTDTAAVADAVAPESLVTCSVYVVVAVGETATGLPERMSIAPGCTTPFPPLKTACNCTVVPTRIVAFEEAEKLAITGGGDAEAGGGAPCDPQPTNATAPRRRAGKPVGAATFVSESRLLGSILPRPG